MTPDVRTLGRRLAGRLPGWLTDPVPRDHRETDEAFHHRRRVVAAVSVAGAGLLGVSLSTEPDSREFYGLTFGVAATWLLGGLASGPLHLGRQAHGDALRRPVVTPIATGAAAFGAFYGAALVARRIPLLERPLTSIVQYAKQGSDPLVYATTLANGAAEEVFFRGALYAAVGAQHPVIRSTAVYGLATIATRNPALVLASVVMGGLFGQQRKVTGGIQAPVLTHLTWSALMLRYLPPLFRERPAGPGGQVESL
ncbi:MAG TPA: CPBP family intramembrane glutamic endopeptidase [Mycobacteriales bacterium]|nr:CPBP family intramembrane glutamic endopeptidase [Mycobacteriales bacterium]